MDFSLSAFVGIYIENREKFKPYLFFELNQCNVPPMNTENMQILILWWKYMVCYWKNRIKADFSNLRLKNKAKKPRYLGYFLPKQEVTSCLTWLAFAALKTTTDEYLDTPIPGKMPSKRWIFRWKKCPIFCGSIFSRISGLNQKNGFISLNT